MTASEGGGHWARDIVDVCANDPNLIIRVDLRKRLILVKWLVGLNNEEIKQDGKY